MKDLTINKICQEAYKTAEEKGWHEEHRSPETHLLLMHAEISEATEELRKNANPRHLYFDEEKVNKPEGCGIELADTVIRIAHFCQIFGIDLQACIAAKLEYNKTRPHKHGGKLF